MSTRHRGRHQAGRLLWQLAGVGAVTAAGAGGWWAASDYRLEAELDGAVCRITHLPYGDAPPAADLAASCEVLRARLAAARCLVTDDESARWCGADPAMAKASQRLAVVIGPTARNIDRKWMSGPLRSWRHADLLGRMGLFSHGGKPCGVGFDEPEISVLIGGSQVCLAFKADDWTLVTARHCTHTGISRAPQTMALRCGGVDVQGVCHAAGGSGDADIAVCKLQAPLPAGCGRSYAASKFPPPFPGVPSDVEVVSRGNQCAKRDAASALQPWSSASTGIFVDLGSDGPGLGPGDSGGGVLIRSGGTKGGLAVNSEVSGKVATVVPTWVVPECLWENPVPAACP